MEGVMVGSARHRLLASSSQRWVFDLQACQTPGSAHRGVGRYSNALFQALRSAGSAVDFRAVVSDALPHAMNHVGLSSDRVTRVPAMPEGLGKRKAHGGPQDDLDAILLSHRLAPLKADLVHVSHVFEGFGERVALPSHSYKAPGQVLSATLYDLIPLLFQSHYFQSVEFERWYHARLDWLRKADLLLAISESSRQDAVSLLGIDPSRVVTIHGGVGAQFAPAANRESLREDLRRRYNLRDRFVLYTGGDDHRKNIAGGIRGYADVPAHIRAHCQFVVVCEMAEDRKSMYAEIGRQAGLADSELLVTGFVSEADLVAFYQCCNAFVFPSLYEGLGLPVIEAMACGAPTIGGNNSSIREIIARDDAMFDAGSATATAQVLSKVLTDDGFAQNLSSYGLDRAKAFNWQRTAELASEALAESVLRAQSSGVQTAVSGWLPKKKLAVLTPLPPCRSGIADYNAKFLPYLARHFDIDLIVDHYPVVDVSLTSTFPILDATQFERVAHLYDAILYEFGNSEFHSYMLPLLARFPGIVGLHDAYLSGLQGYMDFHVGNSGSYPRTMIAAHGSRARRFYAPMMRHPEPNGGTMVELPATKPIIDAAIGLISHSPFNLKVARQNHPEGWQAPYRTIPQMVHLPQLRSAVDSAAIRAELGFSDSAIVVATFGQVVWTKWGDRLLEAFMNSPLRDDADVYLVYVGELARDAFGQGIADRISNAGLGNRIQITGFVDEGRYNAFLAAADLAIQLRTKSRGGTPKGVLDCLANGLPVIVNDDASYRDYPADVAFKLPADPSTDEIACALTELGRSPEKRQSFATRGRQHVRDHHDPEACAAMYASAIAECVKRDHLVARQAAVTALAPLVARCPESAQLTSELTRFMLAPFQAVFQRRQIFVDVSFIAEHDHETGIQRVVKKVVQNLYTMDVTGTEAVAVRLKEGRLCVASRWLDGQGLLHPQEIDNLEPDRAVVFRAGDILFMLDSSWDRYLEFYPFFDQAREVGASVITAVYDLLPLLIPSAFVDGGSAWFRNWLIRAVNSSDAMLAISHAVARDVQHFINQQPDLSRRPRVGYWHLGSDIVKSTTPISPTDAMSKLMSRPYVLVVGTIEPRKSHALVLEAMEVLWGEGVDLNLCIVGKEGWSVSHFMATMRGHAQLGRKLYLFEQLDDTNITWMYEHAAGLLLISKGEGFGLPLVEAANHGTAILCSDLPVFREICGGFATYVSSWEPKPLAAELSAWWHAYQGGQLPDTRGMPRLTWEQSTKALLNVIVNEQWIG